MARWCPVCNRPKEGHDREHVMVNTITGSTPINVRRCKLKRVKAKKGDPYPIYRSVQPA